jgi:hypothetical protein
MPREQRAVAHALAEQYGLASSSYGQEPTRYVELFKTPGAGGPSRLLSRRDCGMCMCMVWRCSWEGCVLLFSKDVGRGRQGYPHLVLQRAALPQGSAHCACGAGGGIAEGGGRAPHAPHR